jgi:hypothetical protein
MRALKDDFGWTDAESKAGVRWLWQKNKGEIQGSFTSVQDDGFKGL